MNEEEFDDRPGTLVASQDSHHIATWEDEDGRIVAKCLDIEGVVTDAKTTMLHWPTQPKRYSHTSNLVALTDGLA